MPQCKIHNVGFYKPEAQAIYCMALDRNSGKLAVARADASVEIWNLSHVPFVEKVLPPHLENFSIEGLCWSDGRLFSVGLHGWLVEYDLYGMTIKGKWSITGEAGTCLDSYKNDLAVGSEQGYINIFETNNEGASFAKFLDKQEGRLLCLKYNADGKQIVAGSINAIRIWNTVTGHAIHKMVLGRSEAKKDTVVWCLQVLSDSTVFSGDSRGMLTLWDTKLGAQIESYQSHQADITSICVDEKEESIYCAGVDPLISNYQKVKVGTNMKWVRSTQRKIHDHDVRAMVLLRGRLYSAGMDSYLVCSYHPPKTLIKYAPSVQNPCAQVATGQDRRILLIYPRRVEVWSLSWPETGPDPKSVRPKENPRKLVVIQRLGKNWEDKDEAEGVLCSSMSSDGKWIFLGTCSGFGLYRLEMAKGKPKLHKVDMDDNSAVCVRAAFNEKHQQLLVAVNSGTLTVYDLEDNDPFVSQRIDLRAHLTDAVFLMTLSRCSKYLVISDAESNVAVFQHGNDGYSLVSKLPRFQGTPTAMAVNFDSTSLVVACADTKIYNYNLLDRKSTELSSQLDNYAAWKGRTHPIKSVTFDASNNIFLHDDNSIFVIIKSSETSESRTNSAKRPKKAPLLNGDVATLTLKTIPKGKHLVQLATLSKDEFVAVQVNPLSILEQLPPVFAQKSFGSK